jgi:predicted RNase H-like HicB family nuclease
MNFQVIFTYDEDYEGYVADVPSLPGCMSQGKTLEEAMENIRDAIRGVLLVMEKEGEPYQPSLRTILVGDIAV